MTAGEGNPRATLAELREQLQQLAESVTGYAPPPKPDRFERRDPHKIGPEWHVPNFRGAAAGHIVRVIENDEPPRCVYVEGGSFSWGGDLEAFTTKEARALAMALLAAADWVDGHDELGKRRSQREAKPSDPRAGRQ